MRFNVGKNRDSLPKGFNLIKLSLAFPETILSWSHGEVTKSETINYRTQKPEMGGLFCERIFGPVKDYECNCGKYKGPKYKGHICERCKVEVTKSSVRRERMGHVELAVPVAHIWFYKVTPTRIGGLLDLTKSQLQRVLYYESYIVTDPGDAPLKKKQLLPAEDYHKLQEEYHGSFTAKMGAEAIYDLLKNINIEATAETLRAQIKSERSSHKKKKLLKKLSIVEAFRNSGNKPEWMIIRVLPVIPPDIRPLVPLEGGVFATSDVNDLYRRVITRNNRLKNLVDIDAPDIILRNERRMLQEAVDALMDNARISRPITGRGNRPLKSLTDSLKGKSGRFRRNLLGKRVDYSGRSVVTVDPTLKLHECGLPKTMARELFKPFLIRKLEEQGVVDSIRKARKKLETDDPLVWDLLEEVVDGYPILLNRAPTLHRISIEAFLPKLVEGNAIRIHPMVCPPFNADFDGDQMAVHIPLSPYARLEAYTLMLSSRNILSPSSGIPLISPTRDIVIGIYYLTKEKSEVKEIKSFFDDIDEVITAYESGVLNLHDWIKFRYDGKWIETTTGRVVFNEIVPEPLRWINEKLASKSLTALVRRCYRKLGMDTTALFLDDIKTLGFEYASISGLTFGLDDMIIPEERDKIIEEARNKVQEAEKQYKEKGIITEGERYNKVIDAWTRATEQVEKALKNALSEDRFGFNPIYMMTNSGARGNMDQVRQLSGLRGLMSKPQKKLSTQAIIETPILHSFKEGLNEMEYFISSHGGRKGLTDTALKTAEAGYLTRRLVDVAQEMVVTEGDCGTVMGVEVSSLVEGGKIVEPLRDRIEGSYTADDVVHPLTGDIILPAGEWITEESAIEIEEAGVESLKMRSVLTCEAERGVCQQCYGMDLSTGELVEKGTAVGVIAAQSIGEPGTQLTLRTFHVGGIASGVAEESVQKAPKDGKIKFSSDLLFEERRDKFHVVLSRKSAIFLEHSGGRLRYRVPYGAILEVEDGAELVKGDVLFEYEPYSNLIIAEQKGTVRFVDIEEGITLKEMVDESGKRQRMVVYEKTRKYIPTIEILYGKKKIGSYSIPMGAYLFIEDGNEVEIGDLLAKKPRDIARTQDITGGLPRVEALVEARTPKEKSIISEIDGIVHFGEVSRGKRKIYVESDKERREYKVPYGKYFSVYEGQTVRAGDKLCEGFVDPQDILRVKGVTAAQQYLLNEIQEVYRMQGVKIDDKHIGIIVRQMFKKVKVADGGDTRFLEDQIVDAKIIREENRMMTQEGKEPATYKPLLLGITQASLSSDSFIASASFQRTTSVLLSASLEGKVDYLKGLKENVIIGGKIPAGTGLKEYERIQLSFKEEEEEEKRA
ncbi:DNA-directed RNA polymerase subunit beta' [candidate division WOR-3 bacterium]|nr:DNA-directed RNA polymerase subunit beta' [candidate division WOR-3 bacterium]